MKSKQNEEIEEMAKDGENHGICGTCHFHVKHSALIMIIRLYDPPKTHQLTMAEHN